MAKLIKNGKKPERVLLLQFDLIILFFKKLNIWIKMLLSQRQEVGIYRSGCDGDYPS